MSLDLDTLRQIGEMLHGQRWQSALARDLGVSFRTVQRWAAGQHRMPPGIWPELDTLLLKRSAMIGRLRNELLKSPPRL